jgi:hypothetical protein
MISGYIKSKPLKWDAALEAQYQLVKETLGNCKTLFWIKEGLPIFLLNDTSDFRLWHIPRPN